MFEAWTQNDEGGLPRQLGRCVLVLLAPCVVTFGIESFIDLFGGPFSEVMLHVCYAPVFLPAVVTGVLLVFLRKPLLLTSSRDLSKYAWLIPFLLVVLDHVAPGEMTQRSLFATEFTPHCQSNECLTQAIVIVPMVGSITYALASFIAGRFPSARG